MKKDGKVGGMKGLSEGGWSVVDVRVKDEWDGVEK